MKSIKFLAGAIILAASTHAMADPFSGFYVGAGPQWLDAHFKSSVNNSGITVNMPDANADNIGGNIFVGASQHINSLYVAEELAYSTDSKSVSMQQQVPGGIASFSNTAYLAKQLNLGLKLGGFITPNDVVYLRPAAAYAKINPTVHSVGEASTSVLENNEPSVWGAQMGLGYDHAFTQHFIAQAEVDYTRYQSKDVDAVAPNGSPATNNYKIYSYSVGLSGIYKF
ncbi:MAG: putative outer-rane protein [Gammaproteobacteria bacterium]|jgi:outer membrane immunogenic protein|nr:putative outer-rane protein [Gammaproteobacteria bacterium]